MLLTRYVYAQSKADAVYDKYVDFNLKRFVGQEGVALKMGEALLPDVKELPAKSQISFYNGLAKLYEDDEQTSEAIPLYEKVLVAEPDFYVAHRALGYLYLQPTDELFAKMQTDPGDTESAEKYKTAVRKALPHLEKAQACDPTNETLALIKKLYTNLHDDAALQSLNTRLAALSKNCLDILTD